MLVTYAQAEVPLALLVGNSDVRHWRYAELAFNCVWFYVSIGYVQSGPQRQSTLLMTELREFEQLLSDCGKFLWIDDVMVVSPGNLNGSGGWKMERLVALEEAVDKKTAQLSYIYSLECGKHYVEGTFADKSNLSVERVIYKCDT